MTLNDLARALAGSVQNPDPALPLARAAVRAELARQLEDLLDAVWQAEREWSLDNRIELGWRLQQQPSRSHRRLL